MDSKLSLLPTLATLPIGLVGATIVTGALEGWNLPLVSGDKGALVAMALTGLVMCGIGGPAVTVGHFGFAHPVTIIGAVLGVAVLAVLAATFTGFWLPGIDNMRASLVALSVLVSGKVLLVVLRHLA